MNEDNNVKSSGLIGQRDERIAKIAKLRDLGIDAFPARSTKSHKNSEIVEHFAKFDGKKTTLTGRLMSWREHGGLVFADIQDQDGSVQLYFRKDDYTGEIVKGQLSWDTLNLLDIGDFVEATGLITKTKRGEISLQMESVRLISKSIRPLPEKWKGLADKEDRYRRRYLDLTMNQEVRARFLRKAKFWQANRQFLQDRGFIEVETPVLEHKTGGADARPFETFHNDLGEKLYMRISSELYQKRLIGGGFEKVFTLGPNFRNEGLSDEHLQEYYQVEWYWAYADYQDNMQLVKEMFRHVAKAVYGKTDFETRGHKFDLADEWTEIDYVNTIKDKLGVDIFKDSDEKMAKILADKGVVLDGEPNRNRLIDNLWKTIRKSLSGPAFLINEPKFMSPLAKSKPENPELTERFHVIIAGSELGNGYSEINDPIDQLERFTAQEDLRESGDDEAQMLDIDFVEMLEYGMPPVSGYGHSERVFWFLEDITAREGTLFPLMRYHIDDTTKKIYGNVVRDEVAVATAAKTNNSASMVNVADVLSGKPELDLASINASVLNDYPGIKSGYLVVEGVDLSQNVEGIGKLIDAAIEQARTKYKSKSEVKESNTIGSLRELYKSFGSDPNKTQSSIESLLNRVVDGKGLYRINSLVDMYNAVSLSVELPMAAYDLDKVSGNILLVYASEGDEMIKIGEKQPTKATPGELVYRDEQGVICLSYNYRDSDRTKITPETSRAIIFVDGTPKTSVEELFRSLNQLALSCEQYLGAKVTGYNIIGADKSPVSTIMSLSTELPKLDFSEKLLVDNVADDYQRLHSRMVATAMKEYAGIMAGKYPDEAKAKPEDFAPELWFTTGLIHDWDYGFDPEGHPERNTDKLLAMGYPQIVIDAILGHKLELGVPLTSRLSQALVAIDELSGLFFAYSKFKQGYKNMEASGLRKKFKDKAFAAKINRSDIQIGVDKLGISLEEHIANMLSIFQQFEQSLGS